MSQLNNTAGLKQLTRVIVCPPFAVTGFTIATHEHLSACCDKSKAITSDSYTPGRHKPIFNAILALE